MSKRHLNSSTLPTVSEHDADNDSSEGIVDAASIDVVDVERQLIDEQRKRQMPGRIAAGLRERGTRFSM